VLEMSIEVTIANEGDINRLLQSLPTEIFDQVEQVLMNGALRLAERARELVPIRTGHLLESISPVFGEGAEDPDSDGSPRAFDPVQVIADTPYASFVEFGTSKMAAQPFMGPAAEELEPEFLAGVDSILEGLGLERADESEALEQ
jgi:HK97 gp10 family phage protein